MSKLKALIAAALITPFLLATTASGSQVSDALAALSDSGRPHQVMEDAAGWDCCVIYFAGRYYCVPC